MTLVCCLFSQADESENGMFHESVSVDPYLYDPVKNFVAVDYVDDQRIITVIHSVQQGQRIAKLIVDDVTGAYSRVFYLCLSRIHAP